MNDAKRDSDGLVAEWELEFKRVSDQRSALLATNHDLRKERDNLLDQASFLKGVADNVCKENDVLRQQRDVLMDFAETVAQGKRGDCTCWVCELAKQAQEAIDAARLTT